jgi:hypothetical protein
VRVGPFIMLPDEDAMKKLRALIDDQRLRPWLNGTCVITSDGEHHHLLFPQRFAVHAQKVAGQVLELYRAWGIDNLLILVVNDGRLTLPPQQTPRPKFVVPKASGPGGER